MNRFSRVVIAQARPEGEGASSGPGAGAAASLGAGSASSVRAGGVSVIVAGASVSAVDLWMGVAELFADPGSGFADDLDVADNRIDGLLLFQEKPFIESSRVLEYA